MRIGSLAVGAALALIIQCGVTAAAQTDAAEQFASGKALLVKGDFQAALEAFKAATKADPDNSEYFQEYALLRRVINIREQLKDEEDAETWQKMSRALYNYYREHKISAEALAMARALHEKVDTAETAALLAEAQLLTGDNAGALAVLTKLDESARTPQTDVLHGIALAHVGRSDEAKAIATRIELPKDCDGPLCLNAARLYALTDDSAKALAALRCAFENTPVSRLEAVKAEAKECPDLAALKTAPEYASAMETKSKVTGGCAKDCGKCPSKAKAGCASEKEKEHAAGCTGHEKAGE